MKFETVSSLSNVKPSSGINYLYQYLHLKIEIRSARLVSTFEDQDQDLIPGKNIPFKFELSNRHRRSNNFNQQLPKFEHFHQDRDRVRDSSLSIATRRNFSLKIEF